MPIAMGSFVTFFDYNIVRPPGIFVGLANYRDVLTDARFYTSLANTFEFFLIMLGFSFWPPILIAILVNEARKGKTLLRTLYFIPAIAPSIAMTVLWKYVWQPDYGLANYFMKVAGLPMQKWLNDPSIVKLCLIFPHFLMAGGLAFVIYLAALQSIPEEEFEASMIDGANFFQKIIYIVFPHLTNVISLMLVLQLIDAFNYFDEPMIMTGGGPLGKTETLIMYSFKAAYRDSRYSFAITLAVITFLIVLACTVIKESITKKDDA
jgi:multiple sugar transport system permease protein